MIYDISAARAPSMVTIPVEELDRLHKIEELLWEIECDLPSGLESWIDYEELNKLRN
ncbi:antitoxin from a toxin-antitoxin system [Yersinia phage fPS-65]|uniref:Phage protein n=1 Tax=Yersinia phage fPS-65 TaxID=2052931 RepID=A0A449C4J1_9CAUD|nr:antitoxin from a toxin-antitoxin system [Yersinia phage fPS-65]VEV89283.1 Phage protein [Yersinia phage fPS-65]